MNINPVDKFRDDFFDKLIREEREKENARIMNQKKCFHTYNLMGILNTSGYQERTCSKCGHSVIKSIRVWEGTKNGNCIIA
jgi:hypothetical protein